MMTRTWIVMMKLDGWKEPKIWVTINTEETFVNGETMLDWYAKTYGFERESLSLMNDYPIQTLTFSTEMAIKEQVEKEKNLGKSKEEILQELKPAYCIREDDFKEIVEKVFSEN